MLSMGVRADRIESTDINFRNVLVPLDFSESSRQAIEYALPLIKEFGSELHLVHVFETDYPFASLTAMPLIVPELEVGRRVRRHLNEWTKSCGIMLRRENIHAIKGRPFEEICNLARKIDTDLIVMSTRGNTGLKHLALGSTAERVVRYSPCPVLVVRGVHGEKGARRNGKSSVTKIRRIVVPVDFSECSMKGLAYAKALARRFDARLILLHSTALQYYVTSDEYARYDFPMLMQQEEKLARKQMTDLVRNIRSEGVDASCSLQIGHAGEQICARAMDHRADLIVTSTHGRTGLRHVLLGSTAEYVVRHAQSPVLVVPSHERPALKSQEKTI